MRAEGHQLFDTSPTLPAGYSIPLAVCSLCTTGIGKTGFFQAEQDKGTLEILPLTHTGQKATPKEGRSWLREKRALETQLMKKNTPAGSLDGTRPAKRTRGKKQNYRDGQTLHPNNSHSCPVQVPLASYKPCPSRRLSLPGWQIAMSEPCWYGSFRRTSGSTLLPLEISKQHLEIRYFEAISGPAPHSQKNCI